VEEREGKLPSKWEVEESDRQAELARIKKNGADAKWEDPMLKKGSPGQSVMVGDGNVDSPGIGNTIKLKGLLEQTLNFRLPTKQATK